MHGRRKKKEQKKKGREDAEPLLYVHLPSLFALFFHNVEKNTDNGCYSEKDAMGMIVHGGRA